MAKKGSRSLVTAFMVLTLFYSVTSCESEGIVGEDLTSGQERVVTTTYDLNDIEIISDNGFAGVLNNSGMGIVEDPHYGTVRASALIKPAISQQNLQIFDPDYSFKLKLKFNSQRYGDTTRVSEYNIYRIDERWRGNELRFNQQISVDESLLVGNFQVTDEDSIEVSLSQIWIDQYRSFFNDNSAMRDSSYRFEFPGIAIVPVMQNRKIDFLRHQAVTTDTTSSPATQFHITTAQDSLIAIQPLLDYGSSMVRTNVPDQQDGLVLHNTMENILKVNFDLAPDEFEGKEIVNAQLLFNVNSGPETTLSPEFVRPENNILRAHYFQSNPVDLSSEIFVSQSQTGANFDEDDQVYRMNVTRYFIDNFFGETDLTPLYITNQTNNGLYISTTLMGEQAAENRKPRLIITTINPEN